MNVMTTSDARRVGAQAGAGSRPFVVEVFGPAGAGKTTFAAALHRLLQSSGRPGEFVSSARPAERAAPANGCQRGMRDTLLAPLSRAAKAFGAVAALRTDDPVGAALLALFPPRGRISHLRHRRYLARLQRAWSAERPPGSVLVLDQGYLSALCSLAARRGLARAPGPAPLVARAIDLLPPPDLVVWMETPEAVVSERLARRLAGLPRAERLFELDLATLTDQARLARTVRQLLRDRACPMVEVRGCAPPGDETDVRAAADAVAALAVERAP
jgi:RecA/RadA recombinase